MSRTRQPSRRSDTRERIQEVALDLFAEQGYEKTSLREIAERLGVTKAALYYHFKTKEDIVISLVQDRTRPLTELLEWASQQPPTLETKQELLRRYSRAIAHADRLFRFFHDNQAEVRLLSVGNILKERTLQLVRLMAGEGACLEDQIRCLSALITVNTNAFAMRHIEGDPEEKRRAALAVGLELLAGAHREQT
ncbi:TetR/AcrR family transcriptional regulator [Streptomyces sp. 7-21]|uniref:TetR/AcrR family transcriptional regulator n=1 Tax=Streptomyces sp. 7-21 TaxID=2802283 RepID=UPI00191E081D|nr:TetR/AcrR family transcriptional regulator [Streptomyces sp. 7-21]MBL1068917.1 TetR/AcrR family transcriptional regulator [Streptomyces sp. 7-21]